MFPCLSTEHKCRGLLDHGGLLPSFLSLPVLLTSALFLLILLACPEDSVLYARQRLISYALIPWLFWSVWCSRPYDLAVDPGMDSHDVIYGLCGGKSQPVKPVLLGSRLLDFNYSLQHPAFAPTSSHFGHMSFHRKLIARLKLHGFSVLNHYRPKKVFIKCLIVHGAI